MASLYDLIIGDSIKKEAADYAASQAASDPYNYLAQAAGQTKFQFDNPYASLAASLGTGLLGGTFGQAAQNQQNTNFNNALVQLAGSLGGDTSGLSPELQPYAQNVQLGAQALAAKNALDRENKVFESTLDLESALAKELAIESLKLESDPNFQRQKQLTGASNPFANALAGLGGAAPALPETIVTKAPQLGEVAQLAGQGANTQTSTGQGGQPSQDLITRAVLESGGIFGDEAKARIALQQREMDAAREQEQFKFQEETKYKTKAKEESEKFLGDKAAELTDTAGMLSALKNAIENAGETGGVVPGTQTLRLGALAAFGDKETADKRIKAFQTLDSIGLTDFAAAIRRAFPGQVSNAEMKLYLAASPQSSNLKEQNAAILERANRAFQAGQASFEFIRSKIKEGMSLPEAQQAYNVFDKANPLFITDAQNNIVINPVRLRIAGQESRGASASFGALSVSDSVPKYTVQDIDQELVRRGENARFK